MHIVLNLTLLGKMFNLPKIIRSAFENHAVFQERVRQKEHFALDY
jgi:hypothetical protein